MLGGGAVERIPGKESSGCLVEKLELVAHKLEPTEPDECVAVLAAEQTHQGAEADTGGVGDPGHREHHREAKESGGTYSERAPGVSP